MAMLNPCHPGETLRDDLAAAGLTVDGDGGAARLHTAGAVAAAERQGGDLAGHGHRAGADGVEQRGLLDAAAGGLRPGAGAAPAGGVNA